MPHARYARARMDAQVAHGMLGAIAAATEREEGTTMKTILCAVDGSDNAQRALEFAIELAKDTSASLAVMVVRVPPPRGRGGGLPIAPIEERQGCVAIVNA